MSQGGPQGVLTHDVANLALYRWHFKDAHSQARVLPPLYTADTIDINHNTNVPWTWRPDIAAHPQQTGPTQGVKCPSSLGQHYAMSQCKASWAGK